MLEPFLRVSPTVIVCSQVMYTVTCVLRYYNQALIAVICEWVEGGGAGIELYEATWPISKNRPCNLYIKTLSLKPIKYIGAVDSTIRGGVKRSEIQASMLPSSHTCNCAY